ncbi:uncharacterized protein [Watersipora subatra]|uniref:uncharacterized protein n=1 Tax=Watersipora subatra TaxID=2589382 RepID=UPI00355BAF77
MADQSDQRLSVDANNSETGSSSEISVHELSQNTNPRSESVESDKVAESEIFSERPVRTKTLSALAKQNRLTELSIQLSKTVNRNQHILDSVYQNFESLDTVEKLERALYDIEDAATQVNDVFDELYLLSSDKVDPQTLNQFDCHIKEVDVIKGVFREKIVEFEEIAARASAERKELQQMQERLVEIEQALEKERKIFEERKEARGQVRMKFLNQLRAKKSDSTDQAQFGSHQPTYADMPIQQDEFLQDCNLPTRQPIYSSSKQPPAKELATTWGNESIHHQPHSTRNEVDAVTAIEHLASSLVTTMKSTKRTTLTPATFKGDPLQFADWETDFDAYVQSEGLTGVEPLRYLKKFVIGEPRECLSGFFITNTAEAYTLAREQLRERFGRKRHLARALRKRLEEWPKILPGDGKQLQKLADNLNQVCSSMVLIPGLKVLDDSEEIEKLAGKLSSWMKTNWARKNRDIRGRESREATFAEFVHFVTDEAELLTEPLLEKEKEQAPRRQGRERQVQSFSTSTKQTPKRECLFCGKAHLTSNCFELEAKPYDARIAFIKERRLCFGCLKEGHRTANCPEKMTCRTCKKRHPSCLHKRPEDWNNGEPQASYASSEPKEARPNIMTKQMKVSSNANEHEIKDDQIVKSHNTQIFAHTTRHRNSDKLSMVLPVYISTNASKKILVYAMLDTQSDACFISQLVASMLQPESIRETITIATMTGSSTKELTKYSNIELQGLWEDASTTISAYESASLPCERRHIPTPLNTQHLSHFQKIQDSLPPYMDDVPIGLLLGTDCPEALAPIESVVGDLGEPFAIRTFLGWTVCGGKVSARESSYKSATAKVQVNTTLTKSIQQEYECSQYREEEQTISQDDLKFLSIMARETKQLVNKFYQMPLPFRQRPNLPDNRNQAVKRLNSLVKRLALDPELNNEYQTFMNQLIKNGHAKPVLDTEMEKSGEIWYIPHFHVVHPQKKKLRVVFDCSARYAGTCLNDHLLQGPDHINSLVGILCRFRKEQIAASCDIEKMFYNFRVEKNDRDYLRFLWLEDGKVRDYRMAVHLFGATSSPAVATHGLRRLAEDYNAESREAANFICRNFYVDDGLVSAPTASEALQLIQGARQICQEGNLRLHKFASNSKELLEALPRTERSVTNLDLFGSQRTLGLIWSMDEDIIKFSHSIEPQPCTRRGILSTVAQLYDPLGFLAPFTLMGKNILQKANQINLDWDQSLDATLKTHWENWLKHLKELDGLDIPRYLKPNDFGAVKVAEIHHLSDASLRGYGACSYLRLLNEQNRVHCTLLMAKARVAPSEGAVTIPRLELQAATVATRLADLLNKELDMPINAEHYWTDSEIVLSYLNNDTKRFHMFVANRIQEIKMKTDVAQWHHIPTKENPADLASRGSTVGMLMSSPWFRGPEFLWKQDISDNMRKNVRTTELNAKDPEVRKLTSLTTAITRSSEFSKRFSNIGSWKSLIKSIAILKKCAKSKSWNAKEIKVENLREAEEFIIRTTQMECYYQNNHKESLKKLNPQLDDKGILCIGGRVNAASGRRSTLVAVRDAGYWIINGTSLIKSIISKCVSCARLRKGAESQLMGQLPKERLENTPPFTHVGIDVFGHYVVKD